MSRLETRLVRPSALTPAERLAWDEFVDADPRLASPYFERAFAECCEEARGDTRVLVARREGQIKAFLPLQAGRIGYARPVGGPLNDVSGLIAEPGADIAPAEMLRSGGVPIYDFSTALSAQTGWTAGGAKTDGSWVMDTSNGYEAWEQRRTQLAAKAMRNMRMRRRRLEGVEGGFRFVMADDRPEAFQTMVAWKSAQYRRTKVFDAFSVAWTGRLLQAILRRRSDRFSGLCSTLYVGDRIAAVHVGMASGRLTHFWFPAYDNDFGRMSPGLLLLTELARTAASLGHYGVEMGPGDYGFKRDLADYQIGLTSGFLATPSAMGMARRAAAWATRTIESAPLGAPAQWPGKALRKLDRLAGFYAA